MKPDNTGRFEIVKEEKKPPTPNAYESKINHRIEIAQQRSAGMPSLPHRAE